MKTRTILTTLVSIFLLAFTTCKKDPQPIMEHFELSRENLTAGTTSASIVGTYTYSGTIDEITVCVSEDGVHPTEFDADINGKNFTVEMTGLHPATSYQYYYSVDYGFSKPFITETKSFTTLSESPTVRTIDVISIDSTTIRVNCETVSDGGVEITERGVCWNTYGNPNLDDEIITYSSAGIGQYSCRISGLALGKKYYIKAYAKNASGIGFGEELEFETAAPPGMPVNIELSCNPEEGGSVNGGGIYTVGSQCTVNAVANTGYTFVNWTENGSQVSTNATYTFDVTRECSLVANFTTQAYIVTAEVTPDNSGTVSGAGGYNYGDECTLTATAKPGYEFVKWTKNGTNVSTDVTITFTVYASATYVAHFQSKSYTISVSAQPDNGGSTTGGGTYNYGQSCTIRAISAEGYTFEKWTTQSGDTVSTQAQYTFTVTQNAIFVAHFQTHNYTISVAAQPSNGGTVSGGGTYAYGQSCTVHAVSASGYNFVNWTENGSVVSTDTDYVFTITDNRFLVANFVEQNIENYDFELGNVGFLTDYEYTASGVVGPGHYCIDNTTVNHSDVGWPVISGTGYFMMVNGFGGTINPTKVVWQTTQPISVTPNTTYTFSCRVVNLNTVMYGQNSPAKLQLIINWQNVGLQYQLPSNNSWKTWEVTWNSESATQAVIQIVDMYTGDTDVGDDYALDDLSFGAYKVYSLMPNPNPTNTFLYRMEGRRKTIE